MAQVYVSAIAAAVAATIAIWGVITQRVIARRRATVDFIAKQERDGDLIEAKKKFIELAKAPEGLAVWAAEAKEQTDEMSSIRLVLNEWELVSIGIQKGVFCFRIYKRWNKSTTLRYWKHAAPFVVALRNRIGNQALYHEYEELVGWLQDGKHKMPKRNIWKGQWF